MHIPNGFLDPKTSAGLLGAAALVMGFCVAKVKEAVTALQPAAALAAAGNGAKNVIGGMKRVLTGDGERTIYKIGMVASLIFAAQMFNFPIGGGTSGHLIGGVLAAVILGPFAGAIAISVVLLVQMLFFGDGGLLALGANIINMAAIGSLACYYLYYYLKKIIPEWLAIGTSAWLSVVLAAFACALEIGVSGSIPLAIIILAMVKVHMVIGLAEALITIGLVNIFRLTAKE